MEVYKAIASVMASFSKEGISKNRRNTQGSGYNFRGIDDVLNALSGHLAENNLVIIPRVLSRECVERVSRQGGALFYTNVDVEFDLVSAIDGSKHTARMVGEAMDSGDKSSNKAMSAAYKYMAFQTFCIPTESDNDADAHTHEVEVKKAEPKGPSKNEDTRKIYKYLQDDLAKLTSAEDCRRWFKDTDVQEQVSKLPADWAKELKNDWIFTGKRLAAHEEGKNIGDAVDQIVTATKGKVVNDRFVEQFVSGEAFDGEQA